jgi:hypothetical protein
MQTFAQALIDLVVAGEVDRESPPTRPPTGTTSSSSSTRR